MRHNGVQTAGRPGRANRRDGFTMLEILLAMTILVIIMLMLTTMFDQSANTWESGMRETSRALEGRTILSLIARDVELAVMNPLLYNELYPQGLTLQVGPNKLAFCCYAETEAGGRELQFVEYRKSGVTLQKAITRLVSGGAGQPYVRASTDLTDLLNNVDHFGVMTPGNDTFETNLPAWVDIELELAETANAASDIQVWSWGPNRADDLLDPDLDVVE